MVSQSNSFTTNSVSIREIKMKTNWQPILEGDLKERALTTVLEIAQILQNDPPYTLPKGVEDSAETQEGFKIGLAGGWLGYSLFYCYGARAFPDDDDEQIAAEFLNQTIQAASKYRLGFSLYTGYTGVGWALEHLCEQLVDESEEDLNDDIDESLKEYLNQSPWLADYDLIGGLIGYGVYALERLPRQSAIEILETIVERLDETAEQNSDGITWRTHPNLLPDWQREICPDGYYNLGLAHGIPGIIALLGGICANGVAVQKARPLLDGTVNWLLKQKLTNSEWSCFTSWQAEGVERGEARLAWCYGDAGVAAALFCAAHAVGEKSWEEEALNIMRRAALRPFEKAGVRDAAICHGAVGLAHIFNRFYQATHENIFKEAAIKWFEKTLEMRVHKENGVAGFAAYHLEDDLQTPRWEAEPGLLEGATGIALSLLAAITDVEPDWDRMLLLSIRT
jgi:lantibiotic modifying enzyme